MSILPKGDRKGIINKAKRNPISKHLWNFSIKKPSNINWRVKYKALFLLKRSLYFRLNDYPNHPTLEKDTAFDAAALFAFSGIIESVLLWSTYPSVAVVA